MVVTKNGENVYPDDVEIQLGTVPQVSELSILGIPDGRGGERLACAAVAEDRTPEGEELAREELT
ncbi:MAG: hypothetical protein F6J89_11105, partial [Symploca sp. SIO1C4]|nr:hypothetical protein [Symploca sp. SIO1C4]